MLLKKKKKKKNSSLGRNETQQRLAHDVPGLLKLNKNKTETKTITKIK